MNVILQPGKDKHTICTRAYNNLITVKTEETQFLENVKIV